tara:strand:+ start:171 stop:545 length:375 start_codon:yes stop_codon:yes gene_type:complete
MVILNCIVMLADQLGQMFTILRTIMVDCWSGLKEEVMAVWEKNIIYILMSNLVWIFKNKFDAERRRNALIDKFCALINEHEGGSPICRYDPFIEEEFQSKSEEEIQDLVEEAEEHYRKPLQVVK